jgi:hypothetical protein
MITIKQHKNFSNWFQVFSFGKMVDEFNKRSEAIDLARSIAKSTKHSEINIFGKAVKIK